MEINHENLEERKNLKEEIIRLSAMEEMMEVSREDLIMVLENAYKMLLEYDKIMDERERSGVDATTKNQTYELKGVFGTGIVTGLMLGMIVGIFLAYVAIP